MVYDPDRVRLVESPTAMRRALADAALRAYLTDAGLPDASRNEMIEVLIRWFQRQPDPVKLEIIRSAGTGAKGS